MNSQLTHEAKLVHSKFLYTLMMEMVCIKTANVQDLVRRGLEYTVQDFKAKNSLDVRYYSCSFVVICCQNFRDLINQQLIDKFMQMLFDSKVPSDDIIKFIFKVQAVTQCQISEPNAVRILKIQYKLDELYEKYDVISEKAIISLLKMSQSEAKIIEYIQELILFVSVREYKKATK